MQPNKRLNVRRQNNALQNKHFFEKIQLQWLIFRWDLIYSEPIIHKLVFLTTFPRFIFVIIYFDLTKIYNGKKYFFLIYFQNTQVIF